MKNLKFLLYPLLALVLTFGTPTTTVLYAQPVETENIYEESVLTQMNVLLRYMNNLTESGGQIPPEGKKLIGMISSKIEQAPPPTDRASIDHWMELIIQLFGVLVTGVTGTFAIAEGLGIIKKDVLAKILPAINAFRTRWLVVISAAVMTILSLTVFKGEGGWSYIEAGAYLLPILLGAVKTNRMAESMGLKGR